MFHHFFLSSVILSKNENYYEPLFNLRDTVDLFLYSAGACYLKIILLSVCLFLSYFYLSKMNNS